MTRYVRSRHLEVEQHVGEEVVYADELFLRIYDGTTGSIRFQVAHSSGTTYENPVIVRQVGMSPQAAESTIHLRVDPADVHLFDPDTTDRLP